MPAIRLDRYFRLSQFNVSPPVKCVQVKLLFSTSKLRINPDFDQMLGVIFTCGDSLAVMIPF